MLVSGSQRISPQERRQCKRRCLSDDDLRCTVSVSASGTVNVNGTYKYSPDHSFVQSAITNNDDRKVFVKDHVTHPDKQFCLYCEEFEHRTMEVHGQEVRSRQGYRWVIALIDRIDASRLCNSIVNGRSTERSWPPGNGAKVFYTCHMHTEMSPPNVGWSALGDSVVGQAPFPRLQGYVYRVDTTGQHIDELVDVFDDFCEHQYCRRGLRHIANIVADFLYTDQERAIQKIQGTWVNTYAERLRVCGTMSTFPNNQDQPLQPYGGSWMLLGQWILDVNVTAKGITIARWQNKYDNTCIYWGPNFASLVEAGQMQVLHAAAGDADIAVVESLLTSMANVNATDKMRNTPLHIAVAVGDQNVVKRLIDARANVNSANSMGNSPLKISTQLGYLETVELLLGQNADVDACATALACWKGYAEVIELLIRHNADPNAHTWPNALYGCEHGTLLEIASTYGHANCVKALLRNGASFTQEALRRAARKGCSEVCMTLIQHGVSKESIKVASREARSYGHVALADSLSALVGRSWIPAALAKLLE